MFEASSKALWCIAAGVLGTRDLADDVLQEAAVIALSKLDQFDAGTSFTAWMGRIVRFVALNHSRRRGRAKVVPADPHTIDVTAESPSTASSSRHVTGKGQLRGDEHGFDDRVLSALSTLDDTARACLLLRALLDMPYRDIALALDVPEGTAMSHVHRARHRMRDLLFDSPSHAQGSSDKRGHTPTPEPDRESTT